MNTPILPRGLSAFFMMVASLLFPTTSHAALLTYDLRIVSSSLGYPIDDPHFYFLWQPGEVLTLQLYAIIENHNASHADDGFLRASGSFYSQFLPGSFFGNFRGDTLGFGATLQNNLAPFSGSGAQSGFQADFDGDGDLDVGSFAQTGNPAVPPWFVAMGADQLTQPGTGDGSEFTEFLIGQTIFTPAPDTTTSRFAELFFIPQVKTDGTLSEQLLNQFTIDGVPIALAGNDPNVVTISASVSTYIVPEPSTCAMALCAAVTLSFLRWRRERRID